MVLVGGVTLFRKVAGGWFSPPVSDNQEEQRSCIPVEALLLTDPAIKAVLPLVSKFISGMTARVSTVFVLRPKGHCDPLYAYRGDT